MPNSSANDLDVSASMGNFRSRRSAWSLLQAACTNSESVEAPINTVSLSVNSLCFLLNSAISVGQTKVKSLGHQNITVHLPSALAYSCVISVNSLPFSIDTTAFFLKAGNFSPMDKTLLDILLICFKQEK